MWLVRIENGELDADERRDFEAWINADPRHASAYHEILQTWQDIADLPDLSDLAPARSARAFHGPGRRALIGFGLGAAAIAATLALMLAPTTRESDFATDIGQARDITLSDGSRVTLGAHSSLVVRYSANERRVILVGGEALFDVKHRTDRPFVVEAGATEVRDIGTRFNVNRGAASVQVEVVEGLVETRNKAATGQSRMLHQGQRLEIPVRATDPIVLSPATAKDLPLLEPHHDGQLVFENTRLADLASDINRYYAPGVHIASPAIGDLRVTAAFRSGEIPAFLDTLNAVLPVEVKRDAAGAFVIEPGAGSHS
ncbi:anti-FecI sigma factor, FecR [Novosphingobium nitrogenifigens DSM 19370]|uniref:Anti-FecI sigma factor, FecR n=2 Tax=Novosphingobium nitrogenifigens TaxID=378548 RepID=F1ZB37_9SPHN|nr:anti-FecI sigma factor, FecR [Novosphingobium nitrogenifigens DSM 19370]